MKNTKYVLTAITALGLPALALANTTLQQAQITKIVKDVRTVDPGKGVRPAVVKETLQGEQSVKTGIDSRTELLFNDHTITRLGANTHFSFSEGTRNMSLGSGVMLLQVPKGIGGAKIETAAVTAAVTGTTIMIEAGKDYTKLIVLEGECCLWPRNKKEQSKLYKMRHKVCAQAGQEIILRNGAKEIPQPIYVNLRILENTSKLLTGSWGVDLNHEPINAAKDAQKPGDYIPTNLAIIGAGTDVIIIQQQYPQGPPDNQGNNPPANPPANPPGQPPGKYGALQVIPGNPYTIGAGSVINTDPTITTGGVVSYGRIYRGSILDGPPADYLFGPATTVNNNDFAFDFVDTNGNLFPNYGVAAYKFTNLILNGMPEIQYNENGATDIALISQGGIDITSATATTLDFQGQLHSLLFATDGGSINMNANVTLQGLTGQLKFYTAGAGNNITIDGFINLPSATFTATTQGTFGGSGLIDAQSINISAAGTVTLNETSGESTVDTINGVQIGTDTLNYLSLRGNAINILNGFTGASQYSEGATVSLDLAAYSGGIDLPGDISLSGDIWVSNLYATADHDITTGNGTKISSDSWVQFYAGNDITADGSIFAYDITLSGRNVSTLSTSGYTDFYAYDAIAIDSTNDTTIGNQLIANTLNVTAGNNITLTGSGSIAANTVNLTANNVIEIEGFIGGGEGPAASFTADTTGGTGSLPLSGQDFFSSGTIHGEIDAETITVKSRGDLSLGNDINANLLLNQINIDPNFNLQELDLSGATIEIGNVNPDSGSITLKATTSGNLTISGDITASEFVATVGGQLLSGTGHTITAGSVSLTVTNADFSLSNPGTGMLAVTNTTTGLTGGPHILDIDLTGNSPVFSITANSLTVGDISSITGLSLSLTSLNDINGGETPSQAYISNASSVALKVGVDATLAGDSSGGIYYNNSALLDGNPALPAQLYVGIGSLTSFSMEATSITVNNGFPTVGGSVSLTADGGDITLNTTFATDGDATLIASGKIDVEQDVDIGGAANFTATGGNITFTGSSGGMLATAGDANLTASGNIDIGHSLNIGGSANFNAGGNVTINDTEAEPVLSITGGLTLIAGGVIIINNEIDITGSLNLSAGTDILTTNTAGVIFGATDVTLSLNTAAQLSVNSGTLIFTPTGGTSPVPIDMTNVGSVSATASSLTLASAFSDPIDLSLTASNGDLHVNGSVTVNYLSTYSTNGNTTFEQPVNVTGFYASANNGSVILNAPVTATSYFFAYGTADISGTGTINSPDVTLSQGNAATVTQSGTLLYYGTVPVNLDTTSGGATYLSLSAGPLQLGSDLLLSTASLLLSGLVDSQNHTITAEFVTLRDVQTVTDGSGNATNLTITGADGVELGSGSSYGYATNMSSSGTAASLDGAAGTQGSGGTLTVTTTSPTDGEGRGDINVDGVISANGANASPGSGKAGGNGGTVNLTSSAGIYLYNNVTATSGINSDSTFTGGNGGTVNLTAEGEVYVGSTVEVSSSDLVNNRVSARGGNVNITSHATSGVAIKIDNSGQINSLLNQAAAGPGGPITFVADKGGDINIDGKVRADHGTVAILNTGTGSGNVNIGSTATLAGDVVKLQTVSPNGTINIGGGIINADTAIKVYAVGSNGAVYFTADTTLMGSSIKSIAANTVQINNGVSVNVLGGAATVYVNSTNGTPNANYTGSGGNGSTTGRFTGNGATTQSYANRPAF